MVDLRKINPDTWQDAIAFSQAMEVTGTQQLLFCAGQLSVDREGNPQHPNDMRAQMSLALDNVERILSASGYTLAHVVRLNIYTCDVNATRQHYDVLIQRLQAAGCQPPGILLGVTCLAFSEALVEVEVTAAK